MTELQRLLIAHEGRRTTPYLDCCGQPWRLCICAAKGNLSVGVGRNLDAVPLSDDEVLMMLNLDISRAIADARALCSIYDRLSVPRQHVLISMAFNMGRARFDQFVRFWDAVHREAFEEAADEMLASKWARQVGRRADELAAMMRAGAAWV